jgi:mono/diheme cytochrome c family protein
VTEIPEHLLRRSKERRDALGLGGGGGGAGEPPAAAAVPDAAPAGDGPTTAVTPTAAAPAPAVVAAAPPPAPPAPPYVVAAQNRRKIPFWAVPVLAVLPLWGFVYAGSLATPEAELTDPELVLGEELYGNCSGCHGANGEGGSGRPLNGGEVLLTFPDIEDHIAWVAEGSALVGGAGNPYGSPDRPGGQQVSGAGGYGQMPGFAGSLSEEEIRAVTRYEREVLSGGAAEGGEGGAGAGESAEGGESAGEGTEGETGDPGEGGDAGDGGGATGDGGAAANEDGAGEDTGSGSGSDDGGGATDSSGQTQGGGATGS